MGELEIGEGSLTADFTDFTDFADGLGEGEAQDCREIGRGGRKGRFAVFSLNRGGSRASEGKGLSFTEARFIL